MGNNYNIKHISDGMNDPYRHYDYERYPRRPLEGDLVIVRAEINPAPPEEGVFLKWSLNGQEQPPLRGNKVVDFVEKREFYQFELGRFQGRDEVKYRIEIEDRGEISCSSPSGFKTGVLYRLTDLTEEVDEEEGRPGDGGDTPGEGIDIPGEESPAVKKDLQIAVRDNLAGVRMALINGTAAWLFFSFTDRGIRLLYQLRKAGEPFPSAEAAGEAAGLLDNSKIILHSLERSGNEEEGQYLFRDKQSGTRVEIKLDNFEFVIRDGDGKELLSCSEPDRFFSWIDYFDGSFEFNLRYKTDSSCFMGFGERYNSLNQKGLSPDICVINPNTEQGEKTYLPIPFFLTPEGYGLYVNSSRYLKFDLGERVPGELGIRARAGQGVDGEDPSLEIFLFTGEPKKILKDFLALTGEPVLPPDWVFGPWMSANGWNSDKKVRRQIELMKLHQIPAAVLVIEAWSDEATFYIFNDARYKLKPGGEAFSYQDFDFPEDGKWPDPAGLIDYIHQHDLKLILWQIPVIKHLEKREPENEQHQRDEAFVIEKGYCVMNKDGSPYRTTDGWFGRSLVLDFNNPEARNWWFGKRRYLYEELGVDGFKTDGGEFIFHDELIFSDGRRGDVMRNLYPLSYIRAYHQETGRFTFSRSGFAGAQKYPLYWGGDQTSTFKVLRELLTAGLSLNTSGVFFWGWDIAGFSGEIPGAELYIRSTELAAFCPVMQFHSENAQETADWDRTPWNIAERTGNDAVLEIYRFYANLRMKLLPYITREARYAAESGEPLMRPLIFDYPADPLVYNLEDQYFFGRDLLVAPILEEGAGQREVYLPAEEWVDFWNGEEYPGKKLISYPCGLDRIPVFIKKGADIPGYPFDL